MTDLEIQMFRGVEGGNSAIRYERSFHKSTQNLHQMSLGLEHLYLIPSIGVEIEIFGQGLITGWPSLESFHFDYDQCILDKLETAGPAELIQVASSDSEASSLWPFQDRVWDAASAAAQRMPKLKDLSLCSCSSTGPNFDLARGRKQPADRVDISWSWVGKQGNQEWRPKDNILAAWKAFSKERIEALVVRLRGKDNDGNNWELPLPHDYI